MAKFKCKHSGCVYEWTDEATIKTMRLHNEYEEEIVAVLPVVPVKETSKAKKVSE